MKRFVIAAFLIFGFAGVMYAFDGECVVGELDCQNRTELLPWRNWYNFSETQYCIPADELDFCFIDSEPVLITGLSWYLCQGTIQNDHSLNVYLFQSANPTCASVCSSRYPNGAMVVEGWTFAPGSAPGWRDVTFDIPFEYTPGHALVVTVCDTHPGSSTFSIRPRWLFTHMNGNGFWRGRDGDIPLNCNILTHDSYSYSGCVNGFLTTRFQFDFTQDYYTLTYTAGPNGLINGQPVHVQAVPHGGDGSQVTAQPNPGYSFEIWSDGILTASRTDTNVTSNLDVTAFFSVDSTTEHTLIYLSGPGGWILGDQYQTVPHGGDGSQVTAQAAPGYIFSQWSDGLMVPVRQDMNVTNTIIVTAWFVPDEYTLTYLAGPNGTISGNTVQTVGYGEDGELVTAVPNPGYSFTQWDDGRTTASRRELYVTSDVTVTASFVEGHTISGYAVTTLGQPLENVLIQVAPDIDDIETDSNGAYQVIVPVNWSGTITPVLSGYTFNPPSRSYIDVTAHHPNQDFVATPPEPPPIPATGVAGLAILSILMGLVLLLKNKR